mmetsp:Transcript_51947/g.143866  ORF Transcript_51947/g.143866 Transcript_51947/m.143866 type:complete len:234 (+) Transcript_51947:663-1364(+)
MAATTPSMFSVLLTNTNVLVSLRPSASSVLFMMSNAMHNARFFAMVVGQMSLPWSQNCWLMSLHAESLMPPTMIWMVPFAPYRPFSSHTLSANVFTLSWNVAEKRTTCRSGRTCDNTSIVCSSKLPPRRSSASSMTTNVTRNKFVFRSANSVMSRNKVAVTMSTRSSIVASWAWRSLPPKIDSHRNWGSCVNAEISSRTWLHNSRVGSKTRPMGPSPGFSSSCAMTWTSMGKT